MNGKEEAMNNGTDPSCSVPQYNIPPAPDYKMGWKEKIVMLTLALTWYGGFSLYFHSVVWGLLLGSECLFLFGIIAVFASGEWIK